MSKFDKSIMARTTRSSKLCKVRTAGEWTADHAKSQEAYSTSMESLNAGTADMPMMLIAAMLTAYNASSFGGCDGHFKSAYREPGNSWLGVEEFVDGEILEAIRKRAAYIRHGSGPVDVQLENLRDVTGELAAIHAGRH
jgi:hypothetical protein